ncbi:MAG: UBP-type zinc finger domain-containing protein [Flavobacteriales bacterium]|nr:UBP-type zinc finger domain-containing protein [Flavobacteriales bacterium]
MKAKTCSHLDDAKANRKPGVFECEECVKMGSTWVHLRTCQVCGKTHCCDSSPNKHARAHYHDSNHAVIASAEPGETWLYCYEDELFTV